MKTVTSILVFDTHRLVRFVFRSSDQHVNLKSPIHAILVELMYICSAIRFCGITFSYTAIAVLLNYSAYPVDDYEYL